MPTQLSGVQQLTSGTQYSCSTRLFPAVSAYKSSAAEARDKIQQWSSLRDTDHGYFFTAESSDLAI